MKSIRNQFYQKLTFQKLLEAEKRASKNKKNRKEIILFEQDLEKNLLEIMDSIANGTYTLSNYRSFLIYEPKKREIRKLPFCDRIVHQWYVEEFIKPYFVKTFIFDSYACLEEKGVLRAVRRVEYFLRKNSTCYVIKMDIHKYFDSIDKEILFSILKRKIREEKLLLFTKQMIYEKNEKQGLPIGNYTSQYFGNIYLNELDQYVKRVLKLKYYVRYLDDFIILVNDKRKAKEVYECIELFLKEKLNLELNPKSNYFMSSKGVLFLGYKIYPNYLLIQRKFIRKLWKKIRVWKQYQVSYEKSIPSYLGYLSHSASKTIIARLLSKLR